MKQLIELTTLARSSIYNHMADNDDPLPRPLRIGRRVMWSSKEILQFMDRRLGERPGARQRLN